MASSLDHNGVAHTVELQGTIPRGDLGGLRRYWRNDLVAGFLVFLIALPLCLGIASACGFPPIAGVITACVGGILTTLLSNSEMTIKGPAAGLIVIVMGCVQEFGGDGVASGFSAADLQAYRIALGIAVAAGVVQVLFAIFRSGWLGDFFPTATVHGMLAAIGVIIIAKQLPITLGVENRGEPLELLRDMPHKFMEMNPEIALIGGISLGILFGLPLIRHRYVRMVPAQLVVVLVAIPLGMYFDLSHEHTYTFASHSYHIGEEFLVPVPDDMLGALVLPDFSGLWTLKGWKWVLMFALIGSLESLLSARAVSLLDPWRRKTNLDGDLFAVGLANVVAAGLGGLPMIAEIVRSKANIDNGARTRFANLFHGLFLLLFVALVPWLIHRIPLAALGAMLIYTGFRLASPREFAHAYHVGREQLIVFATTLIAVLATDLLIGIAIGIAVKFLIHLVNYVPLRSLFIPDLEVEKTCLVVVRHAAVFSNWLMLKRRLDRLGADMDIILDLSETYLVDHTVMEKLHELEQEFAAKQHRLHVKGLEAHTAFSAHPHAARSRPTLRLGDVEGKRADTMHGQAPPHPLAPRDTVPLEKKSES
jgi:MFS superfamily sulfate permease-like transporter